MSFGDHLEELRRRVLLALVVPLPLAIVLFFVAEPIRNFMCRPLFAALRENDLPVRLQALNPVETIVLDLKLSVIFALVIAAPWVVWQVWQFVRPGLYGHERRFVYFLLPGSAVLTALGMLLLYYVMLPLLLTMLVGLGLSGEQVVMGDAEAPRAAPPETLPMLGSHPANPLPGQVWVKLPEHLLCVAVPESDEPGAPVRVLTTALTRATLVAQEYRLSEYVNFVLVLMAGIAIAFQLPLVILLLGWLDIVRLDTLRRNRKYALMGCAVVAAMITPPDVLSMVLSWVPLYGLYELGILLLMAFPAWRVAGLRRPDSGGDRDRGRHDDDGPPRSGPPSPPPPTPMPHGGSVPRSPSGAAEGEAPSGPRREPPDAGDEELGP